MCSQQIKAFYNTIQSDNQTILFLSNQNSFLIPTISLKVRIFVIWISIEEIHSSYGGAIMQSCYGLP